MKLFTSVPERAFAYVCIFVIGAVVAELASQLITARTMVPNLLILGTFAATGAFFACQRHLLSRVSSAATLLILGAIAIRIGHSVIPDAYLLLGALLLAVLGSLPLLHKKLAGHKQTILFSVIIIIISLVIFGAYSYGDLVLSRMASL